MKYSNVLNGEILEIPAPITPITILRFDNLSSETISGLIDTGADISVIPKRLVEEMDIPEEGEIIEESLDSKEISYAPCYFVNIHIWKFKIDAIKVISKEINYMIIGRDILNELKIILDGKREEFEIEKQ